ncbi:hypothetical protein OGZ02_05945 [Brachyspira hyodysenteriae]|nr:hypothetical protein [Brachyspira hyodysenteriae]MDA1468392.1 hypothetical protein [Brachyspira hyodysenteriae]
MTDKALLRVESDRIDAMMNQVGELVTNKSSYVQYDDDLTSYQKIIGNGINEVKDTTETALFRYLENLKSICRKRS